MATSDDGTRGAAMNHMSNTARGPGGLQQSGRRIVIAAGGTGGHFFPAEALAEALRARGHDIALLTDARSGGAGSAVFAGQPMFILDGAGIAGRGAVKAAKALFALARGALQARVLLRRLHPSVIVGFGGYPTVAPVLGAKLLRRRVPVVLHEQNAVLGRTNRAFGGRAAALALTFAQTSRIPAGARCVVTGTPVRPAIAAAASPYAPPGDGPVRLLVLGGSLGASIMSEVVPPALAALPAGLRARLVVTQQCRASSLAAVREGYAAAGITATLSSFFSDVARLLAEAHLVIARAGASTVAELAVVGRPAILVPLPHAIDGHQAANAAALGDGAITLAQEAFTPEALLALLADLLADQDRLANAAARIAAHGRPHAAAALADLVERAIEGAGA